MSRFHFDEAVMSEVASALSSASGETSADHILLMSKLPIIQMQSGFGIENSLSALQDVMNCDTRLLERLRAGAEGIASIQSIIGGCEISSVVAASVEDTKNDVVNAFDIAQTPHSNNDIYEMLKPLIADLSTFPIEMSDIDYLFENADFANGMVKDYNNLLTLYAFIENKDLLDYKLSIPGISKLLKLKPAYEAFGQFWDGDFSGGGVTLLKEGLKKIGGPVVGNVLGNFAEAAGNSLADGLTELLNKNDVSSMDILKVYFGALGEGAAKGVVNTSIEFVQSLKLFGIDVGSMYQDVGLDLSFDGFVGGIIEIKDNLGFGINYYAHNPGKLLEEIGKGTVEFVGDTVGNIYSNVTNTISDVGSVLESGADYLVSKGEDITNWFKSVF